MSAYKELEREREKLKVGKHQLCGGFYGHKIGLLVKLNSSLYCRTLWQRLRTNRFGVFPSWKNKSNSTKWENSIWKKTIDLCLKKKMNWSKFFRLRFERIADCLQFNQFRGESTSIGFFISGEYSQERWGSSSWVGCQSGSSRKSKPRVQPEFTRRRRFHRCLE